MAIFPTSVCLRLANTHELTEHVSFSGTDYASLRAKKRASNPRETYSCETAILSLSAAQDFLSLVQTVGDRLVWGWTPPGESSARAWKFASMPRGTWHNGQRASFQFTAQHVPGVAVPSS